ncbi:uncharacterized protein LOC132196878 [Neocloeon triangulifer]|uniref:uncharacterized protein LOC132196878 n=1 Tax=Neocloeon triangulifer TaxID=2078957 RepID=UPI00286F8473|nr:uncharacterized protein LOC132196878 [Neocloeon triangulifer]XP_059475806.1 uncharacterized protein LOC132196878 [Neocloeon triangulifer]
MRKPARKSSVTPAPAVVKTYSKGDLVFAKVRGHPAWPARIEEIILGDKNPSLVKYTVFFYGTHQFSTCKPDELCMYSDVSDAMKTKCKTKRFIEAMREVEEAPDVAAELPEANKKSEEEKPSNDEMEETEDIDAEKPEEEKPVEKPETSAKKVKSSKAAATQKRKSKPVESEEESSSTESPVTKKRKINTPTLRVNLERLPIPKTPTKVEETLSESEDGDYDKVELHPNSPEAKQDDVEKAKNSEEKLTEKTHKFDEKSSEIEIKDTYLEYREPEDENMPEDERIVRRLIKNSIWDYNVDSEGLKLVLRQMGYHFNENKIKNWDSSELLEMIAAERSHAEEKIKDCLTFNPDKPFDEDTKARKKAKFDGDEESDDDLEDQDEMDKEEGVFIKYFPRHSVDLMLQIKDLNCCPDYFAYIVQLATNNPENDFTMESQPLPLEQQRKLFINEERYLLLTEEIRDRLRTGIKHDTKTVIALLENIMDLELNNIMISKHPFAVSNICLLTQYHGSEIDGLSKEELANEKVDAEIIKNLAFEVVDKMQFVVLPEYLLEILKSHEDSQSSGDDEEESKGKGVKMLFDTIKTSHLTMSRACEGNENELSKILQSPIIVQMTKSECRKLYTLRHKFFKRKDRAEKEAAFRVCALARSLHPWSDVPTESFLPVLLKQEASENGEITNKVAGKKVPAVNGKK